ncbi:hypothetical protein AB0L49_48850 [Streptomyces antimycoticus]|uniref:hypothetical protein n=1 Tax=Streptomyces antimycoticus TaxID=68175 RepID=UPI0034304B6B
MATVWIVDLVGRQVVAKRESAAMAVAAVSNRSRRPAVRQQCHVGTVTVGATLAEVGRVRSAGSVNFAGG